MSLLISVLLLRLDTTTQSYWRNSAAANPHFHRPKNQTCRSVTKRKLGRFTWETCIWELFLNFYSLNTQPFSRGNNCNWFNVAPVRRTQTTDGLKVYFVSLSVYCFRLKTQGWKTISSYCWPESCTQCYMGQKFHVDQSWNCLCNDCEAAVSILLVFTAKGQSEQRKRIWPQETNKKWKHPKESICFKALKWAEHVVVLNIQKRLLWFL